MSADPTPLVQNAVADVAGGRPRSSFGSTARGLWRDDSDIDLLVVEEPTADRRKLLRRPGQIELVRHRESPQRGT